MEQSDKLKCLKLVKDRYYCFYSGRNLLSNNLLKLYKLINIGVIVNETCTFF